MGDSTMETSWLSSRQPPTMEKLPEESVLPSVEGDVTTTNVALLLEEDPGIAGQYSNMTHIYITLHLILSAMFSIQR